MRNDHTRRLALLETRSSMPRIAVRVLRGQTQEEALQAKFGDGPRPDNILFVIRTIVESPHAKR